MYSAILDNTVLVYFTKLHQYRLLELLLQLFKVLLIPSSVSQEYEAGLEKEPSRSWLLQRLKPTGEGFRLCTIFDSFVKAALQLEKGIQEGEAEAVAQYQRTSAKLIVSDDAKFQATMKSLPAYQHIRIWNSLHIIAWLDIAGFIGDYGGLVKRFHEDARQFTSGELRLAYEEVAKYLGIDVPKKRLSEKCSLKFILN